MEPSIRKQTLEMTICEIEQILKPQLNPHESIDQEQTLAPLVTLSVFSSSTLKTDRFIGAGKTKAD